MKDFTLVDFRRHMQAMLRPGLLMRILQFLPGMGKLKEAFREVKSRYGPESQRLISIIDSMTPEERKSPSMINGARADRIARGSGSSRRAVFELQQQFEMIKPLMEKGPPYNEGDRA